MTIRKNETGEQRAYRLTRVKENTRLRRLKESVEEREMRLGKARSAYRKKLLDPVKIARLKRQNHLSNSRRKGLDPDRVIRAKRAKAPTEEERLERERIRQRGPAFKAARKRKASERAARRKKQFTENPGLKIRHNLRVALRVRIIQYGKYTGRREHSVLNLLGMGIPAFREYLEKQFTSGMTWETYGKLPDGTYGWEIDHIRPCSSFDLTDHVQQSMCFHYTNMRPMWASANRSKYNKFECHENKSIS